MMIFSVLVIAKFNSQNRLQNELGNVLLWMQ
jgi:hypothetical protein